MQSIALFRIGLRPFFLFGTVFSVVAVLIWFGLYQDALPTVGGSHVSAVFWHAHAMIYGYAMAIIVGFLLAAVGNWTGLRTLHGPGLMWLAGFWLLARIMVFLPQPGALKAMALFDLLFAAMACVVILQPIIKARQWIQLGVWVKIVLLFAGNALFYLGLFGVLKDGVRLGIFTGLYVVVSMLLMMARRVLPFFIEKGVGYPVSLVNRRWLDGTSLVLMLVFTVLAVWWPMPALAAWAAAALCGVHAWRLAGWYTPGIWRVPLLWSLYLAYGWLVLGFALFAAAQWFGIDPMLSVHAFAYGGVGMMTLGMMARVSLGHTGRSVFSPPKQVPWMLGVLMVGAIVRVFMPLVAPALYGWWIVLSQILWVVAFSVFIWIYAPMLVRPRVDGRPG